MEWIKENKELLGIGIVFILILAFLLKPSDKNHFDVNAQISGNGDFTFEMGTGSDGISVLKVMNDGEELVKLNKEQVAKMVDVLEKEKKYKISVESEKQEFKKKNINLIFDITDSYREGVINDADPRERFKRSLSFLDKNYKKYMAKTIMVGFLGAKDAEVGKRKIINKDIYTFHLKPYKKGSELMILADNKDAFVYKEKGRSVFFLENIEVVLNEDSTLSDLGCVVDEFDNTEFTCTGGPRAVLAKIKELGEKYLSGGYNRGTFMLDYLHTNDFDKDSDFVIFSDGEFQLTEDVHKKELAKQNVDYRIGFRGYVYNADNYTKDKWFPNYWESAIKYIKYMTKFCAEGGNEITFVGLGQTDNTPFIEFSKEYFVKLFDGCSIEVK